VLHYPFITWIARSNYNPDGAGAFRPVRNSGFQRSGSAAAPTESLLFDPV
jgi:hypothetical protein